MRKFHTQAPGLQDLPWPPVSPADGPDPALRRFLAMSGAERKAHLRQLRGSPELHGEAIHSILYPIYSYVLGYPDSPAFRRPDDDLEAEIWSAKLTLERELSDHWFSEMGGVESLEQRDAAHFLRDFVVTNPGVGHPLFDYIESEASRRALEVFLLNEVVRNEVVDDEVALLVCGLQGLLKSACAANLWDEVGRGRLEHFHTYWLRRLLGGRDGWDAITTYRSGRRPWFAGITSNVFMMLLSRPSSKLAAYGHFVVTEGWVPPHFDKILAGMRRTGLDSEDRTVYFDAHVTIDPTHTEELVVAVERQTPALSGLEVAEIVRGARLAVAGGKAQYDRMLAYLRAIDGVTESKTSHRDPIS